MKDERMLFDIIMGNGTLDNVVDCLKKDCKLDIGFCSQIVGRKIPSAASTAIVIYALNSMNLISSAEAESYKQELLKFKISDTPYDGAIGIPKDITTWSTSQACLALESIGGKSNDLDDAINWLCRVQASDGGWSFNGLDDLPTRIEYSLYPLLAIKKYTNQNQSTANALKLGLLYIENNKPTTTFSRILKLFLLKKVFVKDIDIANEQAALRSLRRDILRGYTEDKVVDSGETHFYIDFYLPSYYLLLRSFVKPDNSLALYLIKLLKDSIIDAKGWAPLDRTKPYSWTTALSMLTIAFWIFDCRKHGIDDDVIISKLNIIKKGDLVVQTYVEKCPLNGGLCNKIDEISREYSDEKIFLDIPYNPVYLTFEKELIKTIKKCGLAPIMAKDSIKSKALLCKICSLIQESKYGLADVSYPTHNIPFELGLLLGLSKNCVILKKKDATIPSDISGLEYVEYQNTAELNTKLSQWIRDNK
jgi:hypothetical protein